jgi:RNA polymerase sigma-70 factor (ECF subfamily)
MTDQLLIAACLQNNPLAQRELYNKYSPKMLGVCYRFAANRADAEDMLQESFIKIFYKIKTYQNKGAFEGWIRRIVVHTCINFLKKHQKFSNNLELEEAALAQVKEESLQSIMQAKQVIECIRLLPIGYRTVLNLYAIEGYSHKEVGDLLDIGESTSRSQYTRAKAVLENILIKKGILDAANMGLNWAVAFHSK